MIGLQPSSVLQLLIISSYVYIYTCMYMCVCVYIYIYIYLYMDWRRQWHPTPALLPGQSHGWRNLMGYSPWGRKESDTTERLQFIFVTAFLPRGNCLLISWLQSPLAVILEPKKRKVITASSFPLQFAMK